MADILPPHIKKLLDGIQKGTKEKEMVILSPEAKKWLAGRKKGQDELSSEAALHKERLDNTSSDYEKFISDLGAFMSLTGRVFSLQEYDRLRAGLLKKHGVTGIDVTDALRLAEVKEQLGNEDTDQAPHRPFMPYDMDIYGDWAERLDIWQLAYIKRVLSDQLNEKYFGDRSGRPIHYSRLRPDWYRDHAGRERLEPSRYDPSRGHMWGLRTEGAPRPMEGFAAAKEWLDHPVAKPDGLDMNDVWKNINRTGGIETIERYARNHMEHERNAARKREIETKFHIGKYEPKTGKAIADSALDKSELETAKTLRELEGRTIDSPPLKFEGGGESQEQRFERERRKEANEDRIRAINKSLKGGAISDTPAGRAARRGYRQPPPEGIN